MMMEMTMEMTRFFGKMPPSQVTELRRRYKSGAMKTNAKLNLIRRSGVFDEFIRFELKE